MTDTSATPQAVNTHAAKTASIERAEIRRTSSDMKDSADRRTELAADRTVFAAERTYAGWVRTGMAALASGVGAKALLTGVIPDFLVQFAGSVLVLFSAFCFGAAVWRELAPSIKDPIPEARRIPRIILFLVNGSLALVAIATLISIWIVRFR